MSREPIELVVHPDVLLDESALRRAGARAAGMRPEEVAEVVVLRRAIDARRGKVRIRLRAQIVGRGAPTSVAAAPSPVELPRLGSPQVAIVGAGPAGLFCAWRLARHGIGSIVLERGKDVRGRRHDIAALVRRGALDPDSNYCFGEGGAGTFSDGKLYTRARKRGATDEVLDAFIAHGAPPDIRVDARPHIGTNRLPRVVGSLRAHLEDAGVVVRFSAHVSGLQVRDGTIAGVRLTSGETIDVPAVVLATGHSAIDVHRLAHAAGAAVSSKPFAVGVRIEHPQAFIDRQQFGPLAGHPALGAAAYRLVEQACGVGSFSFCMCPGGFICPAATEPGGQVVNGWSPHARGGEFANSGFVTEIGPAQLQAFGLAANDPFAGAVLQRRLESAAYAAGGGDYVAPGQTLADFVRGAWSPTLPDCSYPRGVRSARLDELLGPLARPLREALRAIEGRMPGFVSDAAIAVGVETRTSAPVRIDRDRASLHAIGVEGLFPCGEGAGYAGGIMSAALDGIAVADAIVRARA